MVRIIGWKDFGFCFSHTVYYKVIIDLDLIKTVSSYVRNFFDDLSKTFFGQC